MIFKNKLLSCLIKINVSLLCAIVFICAQAQPSLAAGYRGVTVDKDTLPADMDTLVSWKVNVVYYFLDPNTSSIATDEAGYLTNLNTELDIFDNRLAAYKERGIQVVLNLYGSPGEFVGVRNPALHRVFAEEWAQNALRSAWQTIATRYQGNTGIWGFNLLNEPAQASVAPGLKAWKELSLELIDIIRAVDPAVRIILMPPYGNPDRLKSLAIVKNKGTVVYAFNAYFPYSFTHQGLYGIKLGRQYPFKKLNKKYLLQGLTKGFKFAAKNKVPLFVPEFTTVRWAPGSSAAKYIQDMIQLFETRKVMWTYHSFYGSKVEAGAYSYPWSVTHTSDLSSTATSTSDTPQLKVLKKFFKRNK